MGADKLDTIRKLLAKAEGAATPAEAEVYTAKALELAARHGIDAALLAAARSGGDGPGPDGLGGTRVEMDDPYSAGKARLLGWIASASGCRSVLHDVGGGRVGAVTVFGHASDRERVELLYTSLLLQAVGQLVRVRPPDPRESVAAYRRSWLHGFAVEVHRRLAAAHESALREARSPADGGSGGPSVALVLADRRQRVDRAYAEAFPRLGAARRSVLSGSGFGAGSRAGARADLGGRSVDHRGPRTLPAR
ncbi:MAG: DUF2786 domain-containing protein [Pseudonocardiales bacterium]|nr:DUF2786 domain-containing protein [Pseudonocardiales bacterium]